MRRLTTRIHNAAVRESGITWAECVRHLCEYEETGLSAEEVRELQSRLDKAEEMLIDAQMNLNAYRAEGSLMLFRLLKNKFRNRENLNGNSV